jgi:hypothetical protein
VPARAGRRFIVNPLASEQALNRRRTYGSLRMFRISTRGPAM